MITQLLEAIADVEMWTAGLRERIVILAPLNTLEKLYQEEMINEGGNRLMQTSDPGDGLSKFNNILFIEDESLTQIVVRSLVSEHRAAVLVD